MFALYTFVIRTYHFLLRPASLINSKARFFVQSRSRFTKSQFKLPEAWSERNKFWIHAASYGEFEMSWPLIEVIQSIDPNARFIISFYSPSGFERTQLDPDIFKKIYLPLDSYNNQSQLVDLLQVKAVFFMKYDFWFNLLRVLNNKSVPYFFIGTHLPSNHYLFGSFFSSFLKLIKSATQVFAHNPESVRIMEGKGFENLSLLGDLRIQRAMQNAERKKIDRLWKDNKKVVIYGSVTEHELPVILNVIQSRPDCHHILAPHDVDEGCLISIRESLKNVIQYSDIQSFADENIVIVDTYGDLKFLYSIADIAYVGGGFEKGPHNILEPMIFGLPVIIGDNISKFPFAEACHDASLITVVSYTESILPALDHLLSKVLLPGYSSDLKNSILNYLNSMYPKLEKLKEKIIPVLNNH